MTIVKDSFPFKMMVSPIIIIKATLYSLPSEHPFWLFPLGWEDVREMSQWMWKIIRVGAIILDLLVFLFPHPVILFIVSCRKMKPQPVPVRIWFYVTCWSLEVAPDAPLLSPPAWPILAFSDSIFFLLLCFCCDSCPTQAVEFI